MASVNQGKFILFIFCIMFVLQTSACESRRQSQIQAAQNNQERIIASEKY